MLDFIKSNNLSVAGDAFERNILDLYKQKMQKGDIHYIKNIHSRFFRVIVPKSKTNSCIMIFNLFLIFFIGINQFLICLN